MLLFFKEKAQTADHLQMKQIVSTLNTIDFSLNDRQRGLQTSNHEFLMQISLQPIEFTAAGFYVVNKTFIASVKFNIKLIKIQFINSCIFRSLLGL